MDVVYRGARYPVVRSMYGNRCCALVIAGAGEGGTDVVATANFPGIEKVVDKALEVAVIADGTEGLLQALWDTGIVQPTGKHLVTPAGVPVQVCLHGPRMGKEPNAQD